ncbi:MAG: thiamine pyrophosphate-binding protein [Gaiellales bacterium]
MARTGGRILVDQLVAHDVDLVFGVPGESYLEILDALIDAPSVRYVTCRHEAGAANMAEAYGKLTGRPGVCMVTRGPGATHASVGVHTAFQDGTPLVVLVGQIPREQRGREAFQELDYPAVFGSLTKWTAQVDSPAELPGALARAFHLAASGRPGPVVLALPEDMLVEEVETADAVPQPLASLGPSATELEQARALLSTAERPLAIVGGQPWTAAAHAAAGTWFSASGIPVAAGWRCQDAIDNLAPCYAGHLGIGADPALTARLHEADVLLVVGTRLGDIETNGYRTIVPPGDGRTLIHVHPEVAELGRVYTPALGIVAHGPAFVEALGKTPPLGHDANAIAHAHATFLANLEGRPLPGSVDPTAALKRIAELADEDAFLTNGAGNFTVWAHRFWVFRHYRTQLAPASGAMGYGLPAAVAAKLVHPDRQAICIAGDGDLVMSLPELATAVQYEAPVVVVLFDNGMLGTIRMHQERLHPGRVSGTTLRNPDFVALARSFGAWATAVESTAAVGDAFEAALAAGVPALLHLRLDPEALTPRATLSELRGA